MNGNLKFVVSLVALALAFPFLPKATAAEGEILVSDMAKASLPNAWRPIAYETVDGIRGTMLYAPWGLAPRQKVKIPLPAKGRYRIYLGLAGMRYRLDEANFQIMARLERDPAPVMMDSSAPISAAGWWWQPVEQAWKVADLDRDTLVVENIRGCRAILAWVRLVREPAGDRTFRKVGGELITTNDAYWPTDDLDEVLAPIMRFKDTPVKRVCYCVAQGPFTTTVAASNALATVYDERIPYDNAIAKGCCRSFARLHREHPRLLSELADFAHSIGLEFDVSFRTGCAFDCCRLAEELGPGDRKGILRRDCLCQAWDGTPVARFSYANAEVQDYFLRFYSEMLIDKVDGINLIWIRALPAMLFEPAFRAAFRAAYGEDVKDPADPRVVVLRKEIMTGFHRKVRALAGKRRVSVFVPSTGAVCESFGLDVPRLVREGLVDEIDVGDSSQTAEHRESFDDIEFAYFRKACAGTKAVFRPFLWGFSGGRLEKSLAEGAAGVVLWDGGAKPWRDREMLDGIPFDPAQRVHRLKTLGGFDAETYPWHVAY